jgi:uncharacterized protein (DUF2225 family)
VQTLAVKSKYPKINGKALDVRVAPTTYYSVVAKDLKLLDTINSITKRNYYKGGVNVSIKR